MKASLLVSSIVGLMVWLCCFLLFSLTDISPAFPLAFVCALFFSLFLHRFLCSYAEREAEKYSDFEKSSNIPFFYKTNGNFRVGKGIVRNGNIYLCQEGIILVSLDAKPYAVDTIYLDDMNGAFWGETRLIIHRKDGHDYIISSAHHNELANELSKAGWIRWKD